METDITDGGGIDEGHEGSDIIDQETVEEICVLGFDVGEVEVFIDGGSATIDHSHGADTLSFEAL